VAERGGTVTEHLHELTPQKQAKSDDTGQKGDGSDGSTPHFPLSFPLRKKKKEEREDGKREKVAATSSPPPLGHCPNLLDGEL
jgi:hypothetical protein